MIKVVLDTNVYRKNPSRENLQFKALEKLSVAKRLCIQIPYIVLREFQTQQRDIYSKHLKKAVSGLSGLSRKQLDENILKSITSIKAELESNEEHILSDAENQISEWAMRIGARIVPLSLDQATNALEAYFQGSPPFSSVKNRADIPDSFVVQAVNELTVEHDETHVIAEDIAVREAFLGAANIQTYKTLADFIDSELIQGELKEIDLIDNIEQIVEAMEAYEEEYLGIAQFISDNVGEAIMWETFKDESIPDDNHEATISSYGETENAELHFADIGYFGNGQFGISFEINISVYADYYIFKADYYCMDPESEHVPSVTDHNDHYFEAEDEFNLSVSGVVSVSIDKDKINLENFSESLVEGGMKIDEIAEITVN